MPGRAQLRPSRGIGQCYFDALKACKAEIVKAPTPKAMTETPLEGDAMMILKAKMMAGK